MAINLEKGQRISMDNSLTLVGVGLGWDPSETPGVDFDLDASAFMLGSNKGFLLMNTLYFIIIQNRQTEQLNHLVTT
jgi:tellurium resistance protein TerD